MRKVRRIWAFAAALALVSGSALALSSPGKVVCYSCQMTADLPSCPLITGGGGWTSLCVNGLRYYMSASVDGGGQSAPLFVFKDGQVMRMPDTPASLPAPPPPPALAGMGGLPTTPATEDLSVRPLAANRTRTVDPNRDRCVALTADGKVTGSEQADWQRFNCAQYYN